MVKQRVASPRKIAKMKKKEELLDSQEREMMFDERDIDDPDANGTTRGNKATVASATGSTAERNFDDDDEGAKAHSAAVSSSRSSAKDRKEMLGEMFDFGRFRYRCS